MSAQKLKRTCAASACDAVATRKNYCLKHYRRWRTYGDPLSGPKFNEPRIGQSNDPLYKVWRGMITRCENPNCASFKRYGGRGIKVCPEWRASFLTWKSDMGERPKGYTIERKNNDVDYSPENCIWAPIQTQANNTSTNTFIEFNGQRKTLIQWARTTGLKRELISARLDSGWPIQKALTKKPEIYRGGKKPKKFILNGKIRSLAEWSKILDIPLATLSHRIYVFGWSIEKALSTPVEDQNPIKITYNGDTLTAAQWANKLGVTAETIKWRLRKGKSISDIVTKKANKLPINRKPRKDQLRVLYKGKLTPLADIARSFDIPYINLYYRIKQGWKVEELLQRIQPSRPKRKRVRL